MPDIMPRFRHQSTKVPTLGGASSTSIHGQWVATLVQRLRELGWIGAEPDFVWPPFKKVKP